MFDCELVGKIGSMALIRRDEYDIDYNVFSRVGAEFIMIPENKTDKTAKIS